MATDTERLYLMHEAVAYLRETYLVEQEKEFAEADYYDLPTYGGDRNPQVMRLRARAAVWRRVASELNDVIEDPLYRPATESGGIRKETGSANSSRGQV